MGGEKFGVGVFPGPAPTLPVSVMGSVGRSWHVAVHRCDFKYVRCVISRWPSLTSSRSVSQSVSHGDALWQQKSHANMAQHVHAYFSSTFPTGWPAIHVGMFSRGCFITPPIGTGAAKIRYVCTYVRQVGKRTCGWSGLPPPGFE